MSDCIFCKIVQGDIPAEIVYQDDVCVSFKDINPKSRVHFLVVPRVHIPTLDDIEDGGEDVVGQMVKIAKNLARNEECHGYKLLFNVGRGGGQEVFHLHLHLMGD